MTECLNDARLENGMRVVEESLSVEGVKLPIVTLSPLDFENANLDRILIVYGGTTEEGFHKKVKSFWGPILTSMGFIVHCFDYRSNLNASKFHEYGLYDRLVDTRRVLQALKSPDIFSAAPFSAFPLSIMGVSMGGYLAAIVAAEYPKLVHKLILVAPAAYNDACLSPDVKFGPNFRNIIRRLNSWRSSSVFNDAAPNISADCLIVAFPDDKIVPRQIPNLYLAGLDSAVHGSRFLKLRTIQDSPGHRGTFDNTDRRKKIALLISEFFTE